MKHEPLFRGSAVALVTPLRGGKVDVEALHRLVEMHVDNCLLYTSPSPRDRG